MNVVSLLIDIDSFLMNVAVILFNVISSRINVAYVLIVPALFQMK